jgi:hypothetical protein
MYWILAIEVHIPLVRATLEFTFFMHSITFNFNSESLDSQSLLIVFLVDTCVSLERDFIIEINLGSSVIEKGCCPSTIKSKKQSLKVFFESVI